MPASSTAASASLIALHDADSPPLTSFAPQSVPPFCSEPLDHGLDALNFFGLAGRYGTYFSCNSSPTSAFEGYRWR